MRYLNSFYRRLFRSTEAASLVANTEEIYADLPPESWTSLSWKTLI